MGRQMIRTDRHGLAQSTAVRFAAISAVTAIIVLAIFFALGRAMPPRDMDVPSRTGSAMGAPPPEAR